jgi:hypothetical protein
VGIKSVIKEHIKHAKEDETRQTGLRIHPQAATKQHIAPPNPHRLTNLLQHRQNLHHRPVQQRSKIGATPQNRQQLGVGAVWHCAQVCSLAGHFLYQYAEDCVLAVIIDRRCFLGAALGGVGGVWGGAGRHGSYDYWEENCLLD